MPTDVSFPSRSPWAFTDVRPGVRELAITGQLWLPSRRPTGIGVVVMEGLGGLLPDREIGFAAKLAQWGHAALVVDSFGPRGVAGRPDALRALSVTTPMILADAFAALAFMAKLPAVRADAIAVMGFSYGGMIAVLAAYEQLRRLYLAGQDLRFAGHVSHYGCSVPRLVRPATTGAPVMILVGDRDTNVCIERSAEIASDLRDGGSPVSFVVLEGAYHRWDCGDDRRKFVLTSLRRCRVRIEANGVMRDERTGLRIQGSLTQLMFLITNVSWSGYWMARNEQLLQRSEIMLQEFLGTLTEQRARLAVAAE